MPIILALFGRAFFFWTYFLGFFFLDIFLAIFLGQLLKAALLDFFSKNNPLRLPCCLRFRDAKKNFFCIFGQNLIWTIFLRIFFGHFFCPIYLALTEFYNFLAKKNALPKLGLFRRLLTKGETASRAGAPLLSGGGIASRAGATLTRGGGVASCAGGSTSRGDWSGSCA